MRGKKMWACDHLLKIESIFHLASSTSLTIDLFFCQNSPEFGTSCKCCSMCLGEDFLVPTLKCR